MQNFCGPGGFRGHRISAACEDLGVTEFLRPGRIWGSQNSCGLEGVWESQNFCGLGGFRGRRISAAWEDLGGRTISAAWEDLGGRRISAAWEDLGVT